MNDQHLQQIADNYIARFAGLNSPPATEYDRWQIIQGLRLMRDEASSAQKKTPGRFRFSAS